MNTAITTQPKASALALMASKINVDPTKLHQTLKSTVFKGASDEELLALVVVANTYGLNPLLKELYAFPAKGGGIVPVVSIDGWVSMVNNHPQMDGMEFEEHMTAEGKLEAITCRLWRKDRNRPIMVTEHLSECKRSTDPWKMEHRMLRHKALMQCARYAFGFSGITDEDDASDTPGLRNVTPEPKMPAASNKNPYATPVETIAEPDPSEQPAEVIQDGPRGILAFFEKLETQTSPEGASKPWKKYNVHYSTPGGPFTTATTFSDSMIAPLINADEGVQIRIETEPATNPKHPDKITFLAIEEP